MVSGILPPAGSAWAFLATSASASAWAFRAASASAFAAAWASACVAAFAYMSAHALSYASRASCTFFSRTSWRAAAGSGRRVSTEPSTGSIIEAYEAREVAQAALFNRKGKDQETPLRKKKSTKPENVGMFTRM